MPDTVIVGAGIIGCATAYYLSSSPRHASSDSIHLVEASPELFKCASGLAAGFLAKDWFAPPVAPLGALSFALHAAFAESYNGREQWGYSRSTGISLVHPRISRSGGGSRYDWLSQGDSRAEAAGFHEFKAGEGPAWLTKNQGDSLDTISEDGTVAQVDPLRFSKFLLEQSQRGGAQLHHPARALEVETDSAGAMSAVRVRDEMTGADKLINCDRLVITAGAWSPQVFCELFPKAVSTRIPVSSLAGYSLVVKSPRWSVDNEDSGCHAVFSTEIGGFSPEIFSRVGGEIYIAGLNNPALPLPKPGTDMDIDPKAAEQLETVSRRVLGRPTGEDDLEILRQGLCFRPVTDRGTPIVTRIADEKLGGIKTKGGGGGGVFLSAGHGPWGISLSAGTGMVLSELVESTETSADIRSLKL